MKARLMIAALAVALAGCASGPPATPEAAVFAAKSSYEVALTAAVAYKRLPVCSATVKMPCSEPALVAQLQKADITASAALDAAETAARTPRVGTTATEKALDAARAALAAFSSLVATLGVKQ